MEELAQRQYTLTLDATKRNGNSTTALKGNGILRGSLTLCKDEAMPTVLVHWQATGKRSVRARPGSVYVFCVVCGQHWETDSDA